MEMCSGALQLSDRNRCGFAALLWMEKWVLDLGSSPLSMCTQELVPRLLIYSQRPAHRDSERQLNLAFMKLYLTSIIQALFFVLLISSMRTTSHLHPAIAVGLNVMEVAFPNHPQTSATAPHCTETPPIVQRETPSLHSSCQSHNYCKPQDLDRIQMFSVCKYHRFFR